MSGGFEVDSEVLVRHAARVAQVSSDIGTAQAAAGTADLHGGAFGVLCSFLPVIVGSVDAAAREAIDAVRTASDAAGREVVAMARAYDTVDQGVEQRMRSIARVLDR